MDTPIHYQEFYNGYKSFQLNYFLENYFSLANKGNTYLTLSHNEPVIKTLESHVRGSIKESLTTHNVLNLNEYFFLVPITVDFIHKIENYIPSFNDNVGDVTYLTTAIIYLRNLLKYDVGFKNITFSGDVFNQSYIPDINCLVISFSFKDRTVSLIQACENKNWKVSNGHMKLLDPRLLVPLMVKMTNSHEALIGLGLDIKNLKDDTNEGVFKKHHLKYLNEIESEKQQEKQPMGFGTFNDLNDETRKYMGQPQPDIAEQKAEYAAQVALKEQLGDQKPTPDLISKLEQNQDIPQPLVPKGGIGKAHMQNVRSGYQSLASVLEKALDQAQNGKGNERHQVGGAVFEKQPICELGRLYGTGYNFGQAAKKAHETNQLGTKQAKLNEIYGAINYLAAAAILIAEGED